MESVVGLGEEGVETRLPRGSSSSDEARGVVSRLDILPLGLDLGFTMSSSSSDSIVRFLGAEVGVFDALGTLDLVEEPLVFFFLDVGIDEWIL